MTWIPLLYFFSFLQKLLLFKVDIIILTFCLLHRKSSSFKGILLFPVMCCIGFLSDLQIVLKCCILKSQSMVLSQIRVDWTLLVRKRRPQKRLVKLSGNHITNLALEVFGVLQEMLKQVAAERVEGHSSESWFPDKRREADLFFTF